MPSHRSGARPSRSPFLAQALTRAAALCTLLTLTLLAAPLVPLAAQTTTTTTSPSADSVRDTTRARQLERVMITAVRGGDRAPMSQKTLGRAAIRSRSFGQDVPLVLQGAAPSLTSYAETGNYWGYSYIRLRGLDQSRINLTLDGIPLNDPEDQVLYFADFPDLASSLQSVQVQRGVGSSSNGTAAYAGSINMETISPAAARRGGSLALEDGSFGSRRASAEYASGIVGDRLAFYGRVSGLRTNGYRYHSGVEGKSFFVSGGYFGDANTLRFMATSGQMRDTLSYLAVPESALVADRRVNPLTPQERDGFGERLAALSYTHAFTPASSWSTTAYRISATGDYDVMLDSLETLHLDFAWYGVTSAWTYRDRGLDVNLGVNANAYARDHYAFYPTTARAPQYFNTGRKRDESGFAKVGYTIGATTLFGDVQARHASWSYAPDRNAGVAASSIAWTFLNPKVGVTRQLTRGLALYASYGRNSREPARSDMLAGFDNIDTSNVAFVGPLTRVKPETVHDVELGTTYHAAGLDVQANLYSMDFRNEIAPIGALSSIGNPLRRNVGASHRRGVEADVTYRGISRWLLTGNASASMNRIREYTDSTGEEPVTYHDVEPLLTPRFQAFGRAQFAATHALDLSVEERYQSRSFLQNTSDARYVLPPSAIVDAQATLHLRQSSITVRGNNLTNSKRYGSGYASEGVSYYYVLPPRSVFVTLTLGM